MKHIDIDGTETIQFDEDDLAKADYATGGWPWYFYEPMISVCRPLFDLDADAADFSNLTIEEKLRTAGVITDAHSSDTTEDELYISFKNKKAGLSFLHRLNVYLVKKATALARVEAARREAVAL